MTEPKRTELKLASCAEQLRALSQRLAEVREDERRRLAQELHDRVGQNLTALDLNLSIIRGALPPETLSRVGERLSDCLGLVEQTVEIVSDVMAELHLTKRAAWHTIQVLGVPIVCAVRDRVNGARFRRSDWEAALERARRPVEPPKPIGPASPEGRRVAAAVDGPGDLGDWRRRRREGMGR